jgi:hypothetical protein
VCKVISHTTKFILFTICSKGEQKDTATTAALAQDLSIQQKQIAEEKEDIVSSPTRVPTHFPVNPRYNRLVEQIQPHQQQVHVTTFNKLSNATSPARKATHQDSDSTNAFPSPLGTQCNGDHFFLRRED